MDPLPVVRAAPRLAACALRTVSMIAHRRLHQPPERLGRMLRFADGTDAAVYRETIVDHSAPSDPVVLVVGFQLRHVHTKWGHAVFRWESVLNTVLFAGFPGFVSKLWLRHDQKGLYRGVYQWDGADAAVDYVRALWWALAIVSDRRSISYAVVPGRYRDEFLRAPTPSAAESAPEPWWLPVTAREGVT